MFCLCSIFLTIVAIVLLKVIFQTFLAKSRTTKLFAHLEAYKETRLEKIQATSHLSSTVPNELKQQLIRSDATTLFQLLNEFKVSSYELVLVFFERARTIGLSLNALAEINIDAALEQAKQCDVRRQSLKSDPQKLSSLPPLYGVPVSIKSNVLIKGLSNNLGCARFIDNIPEKNGFILDLLVSTTGIIPFITSNIPQCLMVNESTNRIYGRCKNPWGEDRTSGGSSGGEASLIASGCSPLGIGSDIGGSIRIPCLYTGLYGIKVTTNRLTMEGNFMGNKSNKKGNINIKACSGPMGKSVQDLVVVLRSLFVKEMFDYDMDIAPLPWNDVIYQSNDKLRIGYIVNDRYFAVSKGNQRAVELAAKALESKGHELIKLEFPNFEAATIEYLAIMSAAGKFRPYREMMGDEPPIPEYNQMIKIMKLPKFLRGVISFVLERIGERRAARILPRTAAKSAWEFFQESEKQQVIKKEFFDWWRNNRLDALISPGLPSPAIKHGESADGFLSCCYTFFFNLLDFPTGVVPICKVAKGEDVYTDSVHNDKYVRKMKENMVGSEGMPLGVQITTLPFQEEKCLNVMRQIETQVGFHELAIKD